MIPTKLLNIVCSLLAVAFLSACGDGSNSGQGNGGNSGEKKVRIVFVTNGVDPFWNIAENGALAAAKELNVDVEVYMPPKATITEQKEFLENKLTLGVDGVAISPIKPEAQNGFLNEVAKETNLVTHDSDAPDSDRLMFIGMDNYKAGRAAGKLVKEAIPEGGKVMLFVGRLDQLNARQRRQGIIDELLDEPMQSGLNMTQTPNDGPVSNDKYTILDTRTDNFQAEKAKANAEDAISLYPDLDCMVGLFAYNIPNCLQAVKQADKVGTIKLVSFDENRATLEGIKAGEVHGTISQQPYEYGFQSVKILTALAKGDKSVLREDKYLEVGIVEVRQDNVASFAEKVAELSVSPSSK